MTKESSRPEVRKRTKPPDSLWHQAFHEHYAPCVEQLVRKYQCSYDLAENCCMEALLRFGQEVQAKRFVNQSLGGFIWKLSDNNYKQYLRKAKPLVHLEVEGLEHLQLKKNCFENPLVQQEKTLESMSLWEHRKQAFQKAWNKLDSRSQQLLIAFYIDKIPLKVLQKSMNFSSYDVIRDKRRRSFNLLKKWAIFYMEESRAYN